MSLASKKNRDLRQPAGNNRASGGGGGPRRHCKFCCFPLCIHYCVTKHVSTEFRCSKPASCRRVAHLSICRSVDQPSLLSGGEGCGSTNGAGLVGRRGKKVAYQHSIRVPAAPASHTHHHPRPSSPNRSDRGKKFSSSGSRLLKEEVLTWVRVIDGGSLRPELW